MLYRKKYVLAKIEGTYGTDPTPTGAEAVLTKNCQIQVQQGNRVSRDVDRPTLGNDREFATSLYTTVSFDVELAGSGAAGTAPAYGPLLRACGMSETITALTDVVYDPVSTAFESITLYYIADGQLFAVTGARGTVSFSLSKDSLPMMSFTFTGLHNAPTAAGAITPNTTGFVAPVPVTATNTPTYTVASYAALGETFTMDVANQVVYRNVVNSESVQITDRATAGTLAFEEPALATKDFYAICAASTSVPIQIIHGTTAGNIVQIDAATVGLSQPAKTDSDGITVLTMSTRFIPTDAGDDEFSLTVK